MIEGLTADAARLARGEVSARELVEYSLDRIERDTLGAFRVTCAEPALEEADRADRWRGRDRPPLLGVPVAIKDDTDLAGHITPFGCRGSHLPKDADSEVVRKLRAAGAIIVGKTNTSELGQWPTGETGYGTVRNPWNREHTPGGSSAGSAAAVAAGMVSGAVGSDGAGSLRIPAAWTGLVGLKPQRGRVSIWPYVDSFYGIAVAGPLTRTVEDSALLLDVLTGNHPDDLHRPPAPDEPYRRAAAREPGRLRIALSFRTPFGVPSAVDPEIRAAVLRLADVLTNLGHDVFPADPDYGLIGLNFLPRGTAGVADWLEATPDAEPEPATITEAFLGRHFGRRLVPLARRTEPWMARRIGRVFERADVVLTPATARLPLRIGALSGHGWLVTGHAAAGACPFCWAWNVIGWPAIGVPAGLSAGGLPIGAQFLGRANDEATLLSLAAQLEAAERWPDRRPADVQSSVRGVV